MNRFLGVLAAAVITACLALIGWAVYAAIVDPGHGTITSKHYRPAYTTTTCTTTNKVTIVVYVLCATAWIGGLLVMDLRARWMRRRDPVDEHAEEYQRSGWLFGPERLFTEEQVRRLREQAAADGAKPAEQTPLLVEIYAAQTRYRFPGIYGQEQL